MLSTSSTAPISNTIERAICATTSRLRMFTAARIRLGTPGWPASPLARNVDIRSARDAPRDGAKPKRTPVAIESAALNPSTIQSILISPARGRSKAMILGIARRAQAASSTPSAPPAIDNRTLSARSCRIRRLRAAPSAERTANSRVREPARTNSRPATFAQAISRTKPTAPNSIQSIDFTLATKSSFISVTSTGLGLASSMEGCASAY